MPFSSLSRKSGLNITLVSSLEEVVDPVAEILNRAVVASDLFQREYVIVPTAGVRAWLVPELAKRCGVGRAGDDGIVANVKVGYLSLLDVFLGIDDGSNESPWSIPSMASVLLDILSVVDDTQSGPLPSFCRRIIKGQGSPLSAALFMADRFDRYAARRPDMIVAWDNGAPVMSPQADSHVIDDEVVLPELADQHRGQFELWRELRARIGAESPPPPVARQRVLDAMRVGDVPATLPARVTVVGLQSISLAHLATLSAMASVAEVNVYFVHSSPGLAAKWEQQAGAVLPTPGRLPLRPVDPDPTRGVDQLVDSWLRGSHELQQVLASQGLTAEPAIPVVAAARVAMAPGLLGRLQSLVVKGTVAEAHAWSPDDQSLRIHRCHHLSRQVDVVHDALVHAFRDVPDLQPHDVVILCADIESAAPYLQAAFARKVTAADGSKFEIPLVVDGRSMRKTSDVVDLLGQILAACTGRASVDDVMAVAGNPAVMKQFRASVDDLELWDRLIDRTRVRWGYDDAHRDRQGLNAHITAHSWLTAVRSSLLGVMIPESATIDGMSDVIPVADLEVADMAAVSKLVAVVDVLAELERGASKPATVAEFCDLVEGALVELGGSRHADLGVALGVIGSLRNGVGSSRQSVEFAHFARVLEAEIDGESGRQSLRTGAVTATSLVPLKGVPFKVICLVGFDDGSMSVSEGDADDIVEAQRFVGDTDRRIEQRRTLLEALLAASDRVVITCNGRSIKNNTPVPMVTVLQELVDLFGRLGVEVDDDGHSAVEVQHPLHVFAEPNFVPDALVDGVVWSADIETRAVAERVIDQEDSVSVSDTVSSPSTEQPVRPMELKLEHLVRVWANPLEVYLRDSLDIRTRLGNDEYADPLLPLAARKRDIERVGDELLEYMLEKGITVLDDGEEYWVEKLRRGGILSVGAYGTTEAENLIAAMSDIVEKMNESGFVKKGETKSIDLKFFEGMENEVWLRDEIGGVYAEKSCLEMHSARATFDATYACDRHRMRFKLMALNAVGLDIKSGTCFNRHHSDEKTGIERTMVFVESLSESPDLAEQCLERLRILCNLYQLALVHPMARFGATAKKIAESFEEDGSQDSAKVEIAAFEFEKFCRGRDFEESLECRVFGPAPRFEEVFAPRGPGSHFARILARLGTDEFDRSSKEYVISW